jgi:hypothetical protein
MGQPNRHLVAGPVGSGKFAVTVDSKDKTMGLPEVTTEILVAVGLTIVREIITLRLC